MNEEQDFGAAFDELSTNSQDQDMGASFDELSVGEGTDEMGAAFDSLNTPAKHEYGLSDIPKSLAAIPVGASQFTNPIAASIRATYDSIKSGDNWFDAYAKNFRQIRDAQNTILKSSPIADATGIVSSFGTSVLLPGGRATGAILGGLEGARHADTAGEALKRGVVGGGAGFIFGLFGQKISKKIPSAQRMKKVIAPKRAVEEFNASTDNLQNYLKTVKGKTLSEKMQNFGDFLFKKASLAGRKGIDQVEKQAHDMGEEISKSIGKIKKIALKENPEIDTMGIYEQISQQVMDLQPDEAVNAVTERLFGELTLDKTTKAGDVVTKSVGKVGTKSLTEVERIMSKIHTKVSRLYRKPFDKLNPTEQDLINSYDILRESFNDAVEGSIRRIAPEKAGEYAFLRTEGHMIFQLKRLAQDRAAELSAKAMDKRALRGGIVQETLNRGLKAVTPSPESMRGTLIPYGAQGVKGIAGRGQKVPHAIGAMLDPYTELQE